MTKVTFIEANGNKIETHAEIGASLMQTAVNAGVCAIEAECGGACACGTCHCFIAPEWAEKLPAPQSDEADMLEFVIGPTPNSRLSCQVVVTAEMDGLIVTVPESQT